MTGSRHEAEAYRRGYGDAVVFGWHCLTCDAEREGMSVEAATRAAAEHNGDRPPSADASGGES